MESPIRILNEEDRAAFDWLVANVGAERVNAAVTRLAEGGRRPFVSALCRYLGAWPPAAHRRQAARALHTTVGDLHLSRIRQLLAQRCAAKGHAF
jgi:hypothetical protein